MSKPIELKTKQPEQAMLHRNIHIAEGKRTVWSLFVKKSTTLEDILLSDFHRLMGKHYSMGDIIVAMPEDGAWWAELLVVECGGSGLVPSYGTVALLREVKLPKLAQEIVAGWSTQYLGSEGRWAAFHGRNMKRDKFESKGAAMEWIRELEI